MATANSISGTLFAECLSRSGRTCSSGIPTRRNWAERSAACDASPPERTEEPFVVAYDYTLKDFAGGDKHRFVLPIPLSIPAVKDEDLSGQTPLWLGFAGESTIRSRESSCPKDGLPHRRLRWT